MKRAAWRIRRGADAAGAGPLRELALQNLAARGQRERVHDDVILGHVEFGQAHGMEMVEHRLAGGGFRRERHDREADLFAEPLVRHRKGRRFRHQRMLDGEIFDLRRVDVVPAPDDNVLHPADDGEVALRVEPAKVARQEPAVPVEGFLGRLLIVEIAQHQAGALAADLPDLADRDRNVAIVLREQPDGIAASAAPAGGAG